MQITSCRLRLAEDVQLVVWFATERGKVVSCSVVLLAVHDGRAGRRSGSLTTPTATLPDTARWLPAECRPHPAQAALRPALPRVCRRWPAGDVHAAVNRLLSLLPRFTASYVTWLAQCGVPLS